VQAMRGRIEEGAKDVRSCEFELLPKRSLRPALPFGNRCKHQQDSAVGKIGAGDNILDPVENDGPGGRKQNFVLIREQSTCGEGTAARQAAESIRQPGRQAAEIIEGQEVAVAGGDEQLPLIVWSFLQAQTPVHPGSAQGGNVTVSGNTKLA
jgi:hypothetical protein